PLFGSYGKASIVSGTLSPVTVGLIDVARTVSRLQDSDRPVVDKTGNEQGSKERIVGRRREYIDRSAHSETVLLRDNAGVGNTVAIRIGQLDPDHALRAVPDREDVAGDRAAEGSGKGVFRQPVVDLLDRASAPSCVPSARKNASRKFSSDWGMTEAKSDGSCGKGVPLPSCT